MYLRTLTTITILVLSYACAMGQDSGDKMFDNTILHEIRFEFEEDNFLNFLYFNYENNSDPFDEIPYLMGKVTIDGEVVDSVGVRFKGFSSYFINDSDKKPFKIDFNEFVPGKRYDGLRKLNLNNSTGDASMQREVICYDLMRAAGAKAPRVSFSKVYINDDYWGLYQSVEQVDKEFLQNNFSNDEGNLFKNLSWSKLEWNGISVSDYDEIFSLKTNTEDNDWSGFINFIDVLNNTEDADFKNSIEEIFNVDLYLKTLAVDVTTNNWDSYLSHGRNWYMYEDIQTGIFHWIPWDYNFAFPGSVSIEDQEECELFVDFYSMGNGTPTVQFYEYSFSLGEITSFSWDFGDGNTSNEEDPLHTYENAGIYEVCISIEAGPDCETSYCKSVNTNDNLYDCNSISDGSFTGSVGQGFAGAINFMPNCCETWGEDCQDVYDFFSGNRDSNYKIDQRDNEGVLIRRLLNEPEFFARYLDFFCSISEQHFDTEKYFSIMDQNKLLIEDAVQTDPNLLATYEDFILDIGDEGLKMLLAARKDSLTLELATLSSCVLSPTISEGDLVINEFVASNDSTSMISDAAGEYDDWIEIYNNSTSTIDFSDAYLSDDPDNLLKWKFPSGTTLIKDGYKIIWADKNEDQPGLHCNFRLNKAGDQIYLSNSDGSNIDNVEFEEQTANIAFARNPNGIGDFVSQAPTFKANNDTGEPTGTVDLFHNAQIKIYPNPAYDYVEFSVENTKNESYQFNISSISGQLLSTIRSNNSNANIDISNLRSGFYFVSVTDSKGNMATSKFIKGK